jgi:RNA polymerase sigma factor (sigma-70 family)
VSTIDQPEEKAALPQRLEGARKRAAIETYSRHEIALRRTARRYSICADDADDALQRGLEILLTKAPTDDPRELIRWTQTVVKHEALAVRRDRERILSGPAAVATEPGREDWVALLPADGAGPLERAERHEAIARSREALQALKPQELRALTLLAEGYSYAEIGEITGFSRTKINRSLAEGRERFRKLLSRSEDGTRCTELQPLLSAFCDGEGKAEDAATLREHLRACHNCRATLRAYRAAPGAAAALAPALPLARSLFDRAHDAFAGLAARFGGGGSTDSVLSNFTATGGARGVGTAALAKALAICIGTAGGAAACVATGVVTPPLELGRDQVKAPVLERTVNLRTTADWSESGEGEVAPAEEETKDPVPAPVPHDPPAVASPAPEPAPVAASEAVEYAPEPEPVVVAEPTSGGGSAGTGAGSAAGEFGP